MEARAEAAVTDYIPSPEIVLAIRDWLGEDGLSFFRQNLAEHGTVSPVLSLKYGDGFIPSRRNAGEKQAERFNEQFMDRS